MMVLSADPEQTLPSSPAASANTVLVWPSSLRGFITPASYADHGPSRMRCTIEALSISRAHRWPTRSHAPLYRVANGSISMINNISSSGSHSVGSCLDLCLHSLALSFHSFHSLFVRRLELQKSRPARLTYHQHDNTVNI